MARAKKKKGLPFVVQPRLQPIVEQVGSEESGVIEIERRGYLTVAEKAIVQQVTQDDDSVRAVYSIGGRISRETGKPQVEVMKDLMQTERPAYMGPWEEEILNALVTMIAYQERINLVQATALIICRVDDKWSIEDSMDLHPDLIKGLALLYAEEDSRSVEALQAATKKDGGAEGK